MTDRVIGKIKKNRRRENKTGGNKNSKRERENAKDVKRKQDGRKKA